MVIEKGILKIGYKVAEESVNSVCPWFLYVPRLPDRVMRLKKK